ncbi:hypothetical protein A3Q35_13195 [Aeribacillus pallidus]|uniref:hypothetical protein n=1 Tax=Aeribacillus pallidus TaxID=33936 RepID=UPI0007B4E6CF|nr:hypothetical protein [Aeribacillus pallidus]KZM54909.1 hypothetical protein A3Q35_13195 [Aeribacillus pallidus]
MSENNKQVQKEEVKQSKFGKQEKHTVAGVEYTFQFPGVKATIEMLDRCKNRFGNVVDSAYFEEIMEHVIVDPKVDWEYWETHDGLREVMALADNFLGRQL